MPIHIPAPQPDELILPAQFNTPELLIPGRKPVGPVVFDGPESVLDFWPVLEDFGQVTRSIITGKSATAATGEHLISGRGLITRGGSSDRWDLGTAYFNSIAIGASSIRISF